LNSAPLLRGAVLSDTTLTLYDQNGTSQITFDDDGGAGFLSRIEWTAPSAGTYYAAVRGYSTNTGTYNLQISETAIIPGEIHGSKWNDLDRDGTWDAGELGLGDWKIYFDLDDSGDWTAGEPYQMTAPDGSYSFVGLTPGTYRVAEEMQPGWELSYPGEFHIDVDFVGAGLTPSQKEVFKQAADRWAEIIVGDIPDVMTSLGLIDDVIIEASGVPIDGPGGILGQAGPTEVRTGSYLPACGIMEFDSADLAALEAGGQLDEVIIHEMGHVLGFGVIWDYLGLISGAGGADPRFLGAGATAQYEAIFGVSEGSVPVENTGGSGTRDSHWRESVLDNELMTGWINAGLNPLSSITVASFADMGYDVNLGAADPFLPALLADRAASGGGYTTGLIPVLGTKPKVLPTAATNLGMAAMSAGGLTGTYTVVLDNGEIVKDIDFGNEDSTPPAVPGVSSPSGPVTVNAASYAISGTAEANSLVKVYRDNNNDGLINGADAVVGSPQQLSGGGTSYSISVSLTQDLANDFLVTATDVASNPSNPADVPTITEDSTPPTVSESINAPDAVTGWYNIGTSAAVVTYTWSDSGSGVVDPPASPYTFGEGADQSLAGVTVHDAAGNASAPTAGFTGIDVDLTAPTASVPDLADGSDTGQSSSDDITQGTNPQFDGTAGDNRSGVWKVEVTSDDGKSGTDGSSPFYSVTLATLNEGSRTVTATVYDVAGNTYTTPALPVTVDRTAPRVSAFGLSSSWVKWALGTVDSSVWMTADRTGKTAPWCTINRLVTGFDEPVFTDGDDAAMIGVTAGNVPLSLVGGNGTGTLTWATPSFLSTDRYRLTLFSGPGGIWDRAGNVLDGENGLPSGNGTPGGDWQFNLNVLVGNVIDRPGLPEPMVDALDRAQVILRLGKVLGDAMYTRLADITGDGRIDALDRAQVLLNLGKTLPPAPPSGLASSGGSRPAALAKVDVLTTASPVGRMPASATGGLLPSLLPDLGLGVLAQRRRK